MRFYSFFKINFLLNSLALQRVHIFLGFTMDRGFHFLDSLPFLGPDLAQHRIKLRLHLFVGNLRLRVPFDHVHLHFRKFAQFLLFSLPCFVDFTDLLKCFVVDGFCFFLVKLDYVLTRFLFVLDDKVAVLLFLL